MALQSSRSLCISCLISDIRYEIHSRGLRARLGICSVEDYQYAYCKIHNAITFTSLNTRRKPSRVTACASTGVSRIRRGGAVRELLKPKAMRNGWYFALIRLW